MQQQNRFDPSLIVFHSVCVHTVCCVRRVNLTPSVLDDPDICFNVRADLWCGCCISGVPDIDQITLFADTATMEEVLRAVAKEQSYTEEDVQQVLEMLQAKRVRTVGNLRVLSKERIEELGLPPVVTEFMLRVKAGGI